MGQKAKILVTEDGRLNFNTIISKGGNDIIAVIDEEWGKIIVSDNLGRQAAIYAADDETDLSLYELPPIPPSGIFDVRYGTGRYAEIFDDESRDILISSAVYPIKIKVESIDIMVKDKISGDIINQEIKDGQHTQTT